MVCGGQKSAAAGILSALAGRQGSSRRGTGFPMAQQRRPRVCREQHHRPDRKCMAMAAPGSDRCALHHLEAFTQQRALNRRRRLCGCGAQPDLGYRTCAFCRTWAAWRKRCQRNPALRLDYRTTRFVAGCADHGNAARAAREAKLGTGLGARRVAIPTVNRIRSIRSSLTDAIKSTLAGQAELIASAGGEVYTVDPDKISLRWPPELSAGMGDEAEAIITLVEAGLLERETAIQMVSKVRRSEAEDIAQSNETQAEQD